MNKKLTIFTPTYNREKIIEKAYKSLVEQTNHDFVWMVIDDGSTDNTQEQLRKWIREGKIDITYYKKENGGKHSAYNYGIDKVETEYVYISLDSDDILYDKDTIKNIISELSKVEEKEVGIITLCTNSRDENNAFIKKYDIEKLKNCSLSKASRYDLFKAECRMIFKTSYVKNFKYPEIKNEKFFTEAYLYWQMDEKVRWTELNTCYSQYLEDGLTANMTKLFVKNPKSWYLYNEMRMKRTKLMKYRIKYTIYYIAFGLISKSKIFKRENNLLLLLILYPIGFLGKQYLIRKGR